VRRATHRLYARYADKVYMLLRFEAKKSELMQRECPVSCCARAHRRL
jgi:hypothetical protein